MVVSLFVGNPVACISYSCIVILKMNINTIKTVIAIIEKKNHAKQGPDLMNEEK